MNPYKYIVICISIAVAGCTQMHAPQPTTKTEQLDRNGNVVARTTVRPAEIDADVAMYAAARECYTAKKPDMVNPEKLNGQSLVMYQMVLNQSRVMEGMIQALTGNDPCDLGMNSNEARVAVESEYTQRWAGVFGLGKWIVGGKAITDMATAFAEGMGKGVMINGNNNQVRGVNTGENGEANYTEQTAPYGGIPLNSGDVNPVNLDSGDNTTGSGQLTCPTSHPDLRPATPDDPPSTVVEGYTCSDGSGNEVAPIKAQND